MRRLQLVLLIFLAACGDKNPLPQTLQQTAIRTPLQTQSVAETFSQYANDAEAFLQTSLYQPTGFWRLCKSGCSTSNHDWGADSLTYAAFLRWRFHPDAALRQIFTQLPATATTFTSCSTQTCPWSDSPLWDSVADSREYQAVGSPEALAKAKAAYAYVAGSDALFRGGACPAIRYQRPRGGGGGLKTLETDANAIKAAVLLYRETGVTTYLNDARTTYAAARRWFRDPVLPLYTVYVFDNGSVCTQVPRRFYGSVNGLMIWSGLTLYEITKQSSYLQDALATAGAVETQLADARGVYTDLQAENDIVEPLVEAMFNLVTDQANAAAKNWIVTNARAALQQDRSPDGYYGRFFDGPAPTWNVTVWQLNGGLSLAMAAGALSPTATPNAGPWAGARFVADRLSTIPSQRIIFQGSGIAVIGAIGDRCCEPGHAGVLLDGKTTVDETGVWQNKSTSGLRIPGAVLFAWRWPASGAHSVQFVSNGTNAKEGGPYINIDGYYVLP